MTKIRPLTVAAALLAAPLSAPMAAHAEGLGAEAQYGRASGDWGTEIGAGYAIGIAGFSLTPGGGVYLHDGDTSIYGRIEAAYTIPLSATIGAGVRFSGDDPRPYATVALPLLPKLRAKANAGPKYYTLGLTLGY
ncbi:hypothetical protein J3E64_000591 [Sphingobium sp. OAS761]|uniref:hypothetical protein n=1 Tax=Sphingobium sp. OAS761 TaxID=2817901 RepID=UPI00209F761B|nr:hypothetical protein [Sphingobium sp. OAS761]MCP1468920.1 hypothetical protein [Sphingobium sp. OAS761]